MPQEELEDEELAIDNLEIKKNESFYIIIESRDDICCKGHVICQTIDDYQEF